MRLDFCGGPLCRQQRPQGPCSSVDCQMRSRIRESVAEVVMKVCANDDCACSGWSRFQVCSIIRFAVLVSAALPSAVGWAAGARVSSYVSASCVWSFQSPMFVLLVLAAQFCIAFAHWRGSACVEECWNPRGVAVWCASLRRPGVGGRGPHFWQPWRRFGGAWSDFCAFFV